MTSYFKEETHICMEGRIFFFSLFFSSWPEQGGRGRQGRRVSTKECLSVFGDDIGIGGRHMETADWKIMGNGGV